MTAPEAPDPAIPALPGTYALLLHLDAPTSIHAGRLGAMALAAGHYVYTGSARGPGGLRARVGRHLRRDKTPHWHIDALTAVAPVVEVWYTLTTERLECAWASRLRALPGVTVSAQGFGASDCACDSHLLRVDDPAAAYAVLSGWPLSRWIVPYIAGTDPSP
jgi:Uri superfamily endonuclease